MKLPREPGCAFETRYSYAYNVSSADSFKRKTIEGEMMRWPHEIVVVKKDGRVVRIGNAIVEPTKIILENESVPIEPGDIVNHQLPCAVDHYEVQNVSKSLADPCTCYLDVFRKQN